ncbi:hypothetical protein [Agrobacterium sp. OT33]|uniref:hypothetical protein n=1 Tax=Agrobacterium sp. OT33 TaxID=2815338 RepID=UPI001A8EC8B3|nr:hypothetical protein [Agrobacterium sp. OT33]MBO0128470.1 hypothetical protein [Agrobacterium sp. OT33]
MQYDGRFVALELDPEDESAVNFAPGVEEPATVVISQVAPIQAVSGHTFEPTSTAIINTRQANLIVDDFRQFRFVDPGTGSHSPTISMFQRIMTTPDRIRWCCSCTTPA